MTIKKILLTASFVLLLLIIIIIYKIYDYNNLTLEEFTGFIKEGTTYSEIEKRFGKYTHMLSMGGEAIGWQLNDGNIIELNFFSGGYGLVDARLLSGDSTVYEKHVIKNISLKKTKYPLNSLISFGDNKFQLREWQNRTKKKLVVFDEYNFDSEKTILYDVKQYKIKSGKLYAVSDEGYAVVDKKTNIANVYLLPQKYDELEFIANENIKYLFSYDVFSESERKIFDKLKE